jgi:hypothetical protein
MRISFSNPVRLFRLLNACTMSLISLSGCHPSVAEGPKDDTACTTPATVRDLTGLDGCGKVLELAGGKRLLPGGPLWTSFASTDGQRVIISYEANPQPNICMAGEGITITCIRTADK